MSLQIEQLAQGLLQSKGVDEVLTILEVLRGLSTRYGSKLKLRCFQDEIVKVAPEVGQYLSFFEKIGRLNVGALDLLIKALLQHKQGIKVFEISTNDEEVVLPLKSFLDKQFGEVQLDYQPMVADTFSVKLK